MGHPSSKIGHDSSDTGPRSGWLNPRRDWPALVLVLAFLGAACPVILSGNMNGRGAYDQINFHEPAVRMFADQWPCPDFSDYPSATTPGYHVVLAAVCRYVSDRLAVLQLAGSVWTAGLIGTLGLACTRARPGRPLAPGHAIRALACCLPAVASIYILFPGIWLLPDNAAWWGVLGVLLVALRPRVDAWTALLGGGLLAVLVLMRQVHLWAAAVLWAAAWLGRDDSDADVQPGILTDFPWRLHRTVLVILATVPAIAIVGYFAHLWGGLVVPRYHKLYAGSSPAAPAFILVLTGVLSIFFIAYYIRPLWRMCTQRPSLIVAAALIGLLAAALPQTNYAYPRRGTGLWNAVAWLDTHGVLIAGRTSPLMLVLAPVGAIAIVGWGAALSWRDRWIFLTALAGFAAAQAASPLLWQRYTEPMLLLMLALAACRVETDRDAAPTGWLARAQGALRVAGPIGLAVALAAITATVMLHAAPAERLPDQTAGTHP